MAQCLIINLKHTQLQLKALQDRKVLRVAPTSDTEWRRRIHNLRHPETLLYLDAPSR